MKAIPTIYRGVQFRSRLEARWAVFFDALGVEWQYEPEGYDTAAGPYLPDFWLPGVHSRGKPGGAFVEVKAGSPTEGETHKARMLAWGSSRPVLVIARSPNPPDMEHLHEHVGGMSGWDDDGMIFGRCDACHRLSAAFYPTFSTKPCLCGLGEFDPIDPVLEQARADFQKYIRWEGRAA